MKRVAVNGFGRIGRALLRGLCQRGTEQMVPVAVNDPAPAEQLAALFARDSVYGPAPVAVGAAASGRLQVGEHELQLTHFASIAELPWSEIGVDLVFECSGQPLDRQDLKAHLKAGAGRVLLSNPGEADLDATIVWGLNHQVLTGDEQLVSAASCTSNALAPILSVLDKDFGIERGAVTVLHAAMNDQPLLDTAGARSIRLARAGSRSMVPVPTRLSEGVVRILPQLRGRMLSHALRLPGLSTSALDLCLWLKGSPAAEAVNSSLAGAAEGQLEGILGLCDEPLVSEDFRGDSRSAVVDLAETAALRDGPVRLLAWFDNEWAFACRMLDLADHWLAKT